MLSAKWGAKEREAWNAAVMTELGLFKHLPQWFGHDSDFLYAQLNSEVPFKDHKWNGLYKLPQEAFHYTIEKRGLDYESLQPLAKKPRKYQPINILEHLVQRIEQRYPVRVEEIFCNRFIESDHNIDWHSDQYGDHLFVASFGAPRTVEYRTLPDKGPAPGVTAQHGDLYYMHPKYDAVHQHRVLCGAGARISLAIFARRI